MKIAIAFAATAGLLMPVAATVPTSAAVAQSHRHHSRTYHGRDRHYYRHHCQKSSGTTGLIAGGAGGALLGHALGGGTLGTVAGGVGGALLGKHLDKKHDAAQNRRNGC
jgi:outer membrane lipoprotein SlyB